MKSLILVLCLSVSTAFGQNLTKQIEYTQRQVERLETERAFWGDYLSYNQRVMFVSGAVIGTAAIAFCIVGAAAFAPAVPAAIISAGEGVTSLGAVGFAISPATMAYGAGVSLAEFGTILTTTVLTAGGVAEITGGLATMGTTLSAVATFYVGDTGTIKIEIELTNTDGQKVKKQAVYATLNHLVDELIETAKGKGDAGGFKKALSVLGSIENSLVRNAHSLRVKHNRRGRAGWNFYKYFSNKVEDTKYFAAMEASYRHRKDLAEKKIELLRQLQSL